MTQNRKHDGVDIHLRIKDARVGLDNLDSTVESLLRIELVAFSNDGSQIQTKLLRMHVGLERIWEGLAFSRWDNNAILLAGQVAHDTSTCLIEIGSPKTSSNELNRYWLRFLVGNGQLNIDWLAVHDFDAEDLSIWELGSDLHIQDGACRGIFKFFVDVL